MPKMYRFPKPSSTTRAASMAWARRREQWAKEQMQSAREWAALRNAARACGDEWAAGKADARLREVVDRARFWHRSARDVRANWRATEG